MAEAPGPGDAEGHEIQAVLDGKDSIQLDPDLLADPAPPSVEPLYIRIKRLPVPNRVKLALYGNKETRQILSRDPVPMVQRCVLLNPRITVEEALSVAKNRSASHELLRIISDQREWVRHYQVRLALVQNPKTPLQVALHLLGGVTERDLRLIAKSRNVSSSLQAQARRALLQRGRGPG
jgi:hypothetical protein